jgi:hypothetical protein
MVDPVLSSVARLALALVFANAALHKLRDFGGFTTALRAHRLLPAPMVGGSAVALIGLELGLVIMLLLPGHAASAGWGAAALLMLYSGAIGINLARGRRDIDCGCTLRPQPISIWQLVRNAALIGAAGVVAAPMADRSLVWVDLISLVGALATLALLWLAIDTLGGLRTTARSLGR